jgi:uncharacterized protein YceK
MHSYLQKGFIMRIIVLSVVLFLFFSGCNSSSDSDASSSQESNNPSQEKPSNLIWQG